MPPRLGVSEDTHRREDLCKWRAEMLDRIPEYRGNDLELGIPAVGTGNGWGSLLFNPDKDRPHEHYQGMPTRPSSGPGLLIARGYKV